VFKIPTVLALAVTNLVLATIYGVTQPTEFEQDVTETVSTTIAISVTTLNTSTTTTSTTIPDDEYVGSEFLERCPRWEPYFKKYGLPVKKFSYIAWRESRCQIKSVNARWDTNGNIVWTLNKDGSYDSGLLQINSTWKTVTKNICGGGIELLLTLDCNLKVARYLYDNGGLGHWKATSGS
jgi:hypothetical protein